MFSFHTKHPWAVGKAVRGWSRCMTRRASLAGPRVLVGTVGFFLVLTFLLFRPALTYLVGMWGREDFSYGYFILPIVLYLLWEKAGAPVLPDTRDPPPLGAGAGEGAGAGSWPTRPIVAVLLLLAGFLPGKERR